jgi:hypothetical protein
MQLKLDNLRALKDDWDNDGALAPTEEAILLAEKIINAEPSVVPLTDGGVQVEWHCGADIEIAITPEGTMALE